MSTSSRKLVESDQKLRRKVIVVGDVMVDEHVVGDVSRLSPDTPVPVLKVPSGAGAVLTPGGAGNVAYQFRHWNVDALLLGLVDHYTAGALDRCGVNYEGATWLEWGMCPVKQRTYDRAGRCISRTDAERDNYGRHDIAVLRKKLTETLASCVAYSHACIISDYGKGTLDADTIQKIIRLCRGRDVPVFVDRKVRGPDDWSGASVVKMNDRELAGYGGRSWRTLTNADVVVTRGGHGYSVYGPSGCQDIVRQPLRPRQESGAGDCFTVHLALAMAHGLSLEEAAEAAYLAGRVYVQGEMNRPVLPRELLAEAGDPEAKVATADQVKQELDLRRNGQRVIFANGVFDILHPGHLHTLRWARRQGDVLVVGMNNDISVQALRGAGRPYLNERHRAAMLAALEFVDFVVVYGELTPEKVLRTIRPDVMVKGPDYPLESVPCRELVKETLIAPESGMPFHSSELPKECLTAKD